VTRPDSSRKTTIDHSFSASTSDQAFMSPAVTDDDTFDDLDGVIVAITEDPAQAVGAQAVMAEIATARVEHALGLQMLRASFGLTQVELATALGLSQGNIAQTEHRTDLLVSTLRRYVETITGGMLRLIVTFADRPPLEFELDEVTGGGEKGTSKALVGVAYGADRAPAAQAGRASKTKQGGRRVQASKVVSTTTSTAAKPATVKASSLDKAKTRGAPVAR
jgi:transcriptional regulator with XRE-family HTH domain